MRWLAVVLVAALSIACANESPRKDETRESAPGPTLASSIGGGAAPSQALGVPRDRHKERPEVSLDKAVQRIRRRLDLPLALPPVLIDAPVQSLYFGLYGPNDPGADLTLVLPDGSTVHIWVGHAAWGCGDGSIRPARYLEIMGEPAILRSFGRGQHSLIWPATKKNPVGIYGISGRVKPATLLRWAGFIQSVGSPSGDWGC